MPNLDAPSGFRIYHDLSGGELHSHTVYKDNGAAEIFRGQPLKVNTSGELVALTTTTGNNSGSGTDFTADSGPNAGAGSGIFISQGNYAANADDCAVIPAKDFIWQVQADDDFTGVSKAVIKTLIGLRTMYGITNSDVGNSLGNSIAELDGSNGTTPTTDNYLILMGYVDRADNLFGPQMDVLVRFNTLLFGASSYGVPDLT